ncbi:threonine synthase [Methanococcoides methylutens]|uniref:Threonine synthase n=1 Tax=Methanococcoides methylutens MM1 TaxID=1434104 RepID=A0A0E3SS85_METMT|nr:threonine synthase [Methanococcoides methylutens]AKB85202.1 Threonine synthase [Methanococcoides methylutens MM1]
MKLYSTNLQAEEVNFETALITGLAPDKGLFMPKTLPYFSGEELTALKDEPYPEIAFQLLKKILEGEIDEESLKAITYDAYDYDVPLEEVNENTYIMRLDRGPTASFKDFAARMMARLMQYYLKKENKELTILTATSGDTGSAVAHAFYGLDNIRVIVLFPETEVSDRQRKQMTTLDQNISALAIDGKFDDCQAMVKQAFADADLKHLNLSSANSINIGRLIPQTLYYFYSYLKLRDYPEEIVFSIPSGNFGNMMGCVLAKNMGVPIKKIVASVNENDEVPNFLTSGEYEKIVPSKNCISNAMNVGHPSNLARLIAIYGGVMDEQGNISKLPDMDKLNGDIFSTSVTDAETKALVKEFYEKNNIFIEPHGAVGIKGLMDYRATTNDETLAVTLETAHPAKFPAEVVDAIGVEPELPQSLKEIEGKEEHMEFLDTDYEKFKSYLKERLE